MCKIWCRLQIHSCWINGPESSNIWLAGWRCSYWVIKCLSCTGQNLVLERLLLPFGAWSKSWIGEVNEGSGFFDYLVLVLTYHGVWGMEQMYFQAFCSNITMPLIMAANLSDRSCNICLVIKTSKLMLSVDNFVT